MNCEEARLRIGADPGTRTAGVESHLRDCQACTEWQREMLDLEGALRRVLRSAQLPAAAGPAVAPRTWRRPRRWALAASVLVLTGAALLLWSLRPQASLAAEVVAHMDHEPQSWSQTTPLSVPEVARGLRRAGVGVGIPDAGEITYVRSCPFRGRLVPHLVVRAAGVPHTVLVLRGERLAVDTQHFSEDGYTGELVAVHDGVIAVVNRGGAGSAADRAAVAAAVEAALHQAAGQAPR